LPPDRAAAGKCGDCAGRSKTLRHRSSAAPAPRPRRQNRHRLSRFAASARRASQRQQPLNRRDNGQQPARSRFNPPSRPGQRLRECGAGTMDWDQAVAVSLVHQNSVPSVQMHRRITAILRAMATRAFFDPMRRASRVPHALRGDQRCTFVRRTLAAS